MANLPQRLSFCDFLLKMLLITLSITTQVFYIEFRNLHLVPSQMKGLCCAVYLRDKMSHLLQYRLCYCWKYVPERNCLQAFVWTGPTMLGSLVPEFFDTSRAIFHHHFQFVTLDSSLNPVIFLNQVFGPRFDHMPYSYHHLNLIDGCFQCNPSMPDCIYFPSDSKVLVRGIPPSYVPNFFYHGKDPLSLSTCL